MKILKNSENCEEDPYISNLIWSQEEEKVFKIYFTSFAGAEEKMTESMKFRNKNFKLNLKDVEKTRIHNHFANNYIIGNKKALFQTMSEYYKFMDEKVF